MLLQAAISVVTLTGIAGSAINILAGGSDELREREDKITESARGFPVEYRASSTSASTLLWRKPKQR
jgi:hypothetical protein